MILGRVIEGRPTIRALALLPRLAIFGPVTLLVDTGSDTSVIHPVDARELDIDLGRDFVDVTPVSSLGIAGAALEYAEQCVLFLEHDDGDMDQIPIEIRVAMRTTANWRLPSLLGRDVLRRYRLVFEEQAGLVRLEPPTGAGV